MTTVRLTENYKTDGCVLVLGGFDGVHIGHRRLIERAKKEGKSVGITTIIGGKGEGLFTLNERLVVYAALGVDFAVWMRFDEIKETPPIDFLTKLNETFSPLLYVCGDDFRFGKGALGNPQTIIEQGMPVAVENLLCVDGEKVSTRTLKGLLAAGEIEKVNKLLGFSYFLLGEVVHGRQVGRQMGFPTANIAYPTDKTPLRSGVYAVQSVVDGRVYKGIANFGAQPTFDKNEVRLEVYLDGFDGDLYGKTLQVEFVSYIRPVQKFADMQALQMQLEKDVQKVREND